MGPLDVLGVSHSQERVLRMLLEVGDASVQELVDAIGLTREKIRQSLTALEEKGLVRQSVTRPPRFVPAPPKAALQALVLGRQQDLERVQILGHELEQTFRAARRTSSPHELVEIVVGQSAVRQTVVHLHQNAKKEVFVLDKPPYACDFDDPEIENIMFLARERGVQYRCLYDREALESSAKLDSILKKGPERNKAKTLSQVPMKLLIVDRETALVPTDAAPTGPLKAAILVHTSALMEALCFMWETLWSAGAPIGPDYYDSSTVGEGVENDRDKRLLALLISGLQNRAIAKHLGLSVSSVERRVKNVMDSLGAGTRWQAGYLLARREQGHK